MRRLPFDALEWPFVVAVSAVAFGPLVLLTTAAARLVWRRR